MFRSALLILSGNAFGSLMLLVRNLVVARLISVEDYGIAATFAIAMAIVEMITALGLHQLIVQDNKGNDPQLQAGLQGFHLLRGLFSSLVLLAMAAPIARFLGIAEVAGAYQLLALMPAMNGLTHFDIYRLQRKMRYLPSILSSSLPALLSVLMIWPLYSLFGDYRVMLWSVLAQSAMTVAVSHLMAERAYRLAFDRAVMLRAFRFGWPLLLNNILLFAVFQGDKLIVGRELGMAVLAIFAMGFSLTLTPTLVAAKSAQSFFLPQLSASKDDAARFAHLAMATLQTSLVNGLLVVLVVALAGKPVVLALLGQKYAALVPFLTWLAILQAMRVFKAGSSVVALARGQTGNAMIANLFRAASLGLSWYVAARGGDLFAVICIAMAGEAVGYPVSLWLVRRRSGLRLGPMLWPLVTASLFLAATAVLAGLPGLRPATEGLWPAAAITVLFLLCLATLRDLRQYVVGRRVSRYSE